MASGTGIGEFYISLFVDAADGGLTVSNLVQGFGQLEIATISEIALLWELGTMMARFTDAGIKASLGFEQFTMHTGLSAQELQKWQNAAELSHASAEDVSGSIENITKHLANLAVGKSDSALESLQRLGISAFDATGHIKNAYQILGEVHQRLGVVTNIPGIQEQLLAGLGISPNLREMLLLVDSILKERQHPELILTKEQEDKFDHLRTKMVEIEQKTRKIGENIGAWSTGAIQKVADVLNSAADHELKGGAAWSDAFKRAFEVQEKAHKTGKTMEFKKSVLGQILYGVEAPGGKDYKPQLQDLGLPPAPATSAPTQITVNKRDTFHIHDAHDPHKIADIMDQRWDETMGRKTINGFDQQVQGVY